MRVRFMTKQGIKKVTVIPVSKFPNGIADRKSNTSSLRRLNVAAYCRVSTSSKEQLESYEFQKEHYEKRIKEKPSWNFAGVFADKKSDVSRHCQ